MIRNLYLSISILSNKIKQNSGYSSLKIILEIHRSQTISLTEAEK